MSIANLPEVFILDDSESYRLSSRLPEFYTSPTAQNTLIIQANTLRGNVTTTQPTIPAILSISAAEYSTSFANGYVSVEFVGASANSNALNFGRCNDGQINRYIPNSAVGPTGDLTLQQVGVNGNDVFTIVLTLVKEYQGVPGNGVGTGGWNRAQTGY